MHALAHTSCTSCGCYYTASSCVYINYGWMVKSVSLHTVIHYIACSLLRQTHSFKICLIWHRYTLVSCSVLIFNVMLLFIQVSIVSRHLWVMVSRGGASWVTLWPPLTSRSWESWPGISCRLVHTAPARTYNVHVALLLANQGILWIVFSIWILVQWYTWWICTLKSQGTCSGRGCQGLWPHQIL